MDGANWMNGADIRDAVLMEVRSSSSSSSSLSSLLLLSSSEYSPSSISGKTNMPVCTDARADEASDMDMLFLSFFLG